MEIFNVGSPLISVRRNPELYLFNSPGLSLTERLVFGLMSDAIHLGAKDVQWRNDHDRHFVSSSFNWLGAQEEIPVSALFERVVPLRSGGDNSIRHEISIGAFAEHISLVGDDVTVIKGSASAFGAEWLAGLLGQSSRAYGAAFILPAKHKS